MKNIFIGIWNYLFYPQELWQKERKEACDKCEPDTPMCPKCGCFKELKTRVKGEKCPKGKW